MCIFQQMDGEDTQAQHSLEAETAKIQILISPED